MANVQTKSGQGITYPGTHTIRLKSVKREEIQTVLTLNDSVMTALKWISCLGDYKINISYGTEIVIYYIFLDIPIPLIRIVHTDDPHTYNKNQIRDFNLALIQAIRYFRSIVQPEFEVARQERKMSLKFAKELRTRYLHQNIFKIKEIIKLKFPI